MFLHPPKRQEENGERTTGTKEIDRSSFIPVRKWKWLPHRKARRLCVGNSQIKDKIQCKCLLLGMAKRTRAVLNGQCAHIGGVGREMC
jgi:hypothetical protein